MQLNHKIKNKLTSSFSLTDLEFSRYLSKVSEASSIFVEKTYLRKNRKKTDCHASRRKLNNQHQKLPLGPSCEK